MLTCITCPTKIINMKSTEKNGAYYADTVHAFELL